MEIYNRCNHSLPFMYILCIIWFCFEICINIISYPIVSKAHLWDVMIMAFPDSRVRVTASHSSLLATGSIPVEGSSRKMTGGPPIRAIPALSFRLLPPLRVLGVTSLFGTYVQQQNLELSSLSQLTCSCEPVYQHEAPAIETSGHSPHRTAHTSLVFLWAGHTCSEFLFPSCDPAEHQTEGNNQCAAAPVFQG